MQVRRLEYRAVTKEDTELKHYGVLGMKWGVRKNPSQAFSKASKKASRLSDKYEKYSSKAATADAKAHKSGKRYVTEIGRGITENRFKKAVKFDRKAYRTLKKLDRWNEKTFDIFKKVRVESIDPKILDKGQKWVVKRLRTLQEYNDLATKTNDLYNKRYWGTELTSSETKTLNDGLARLDELKKELTKY